jgi:hypothetical protein
MITRWIAGSGVAVFVLVADGVGGWVAVHVAVDPTFGFAVGKVVGTAILQASRNNKARIGKA